MKKYSKLLEDISDELNIRQGKSEQIELYKSRIIYSVLGHMALASLYDRQEESDTVSIVHFKHRIQELLAAYQDMFPEIRPYFSQRTDDGELSEEICKLYKETGHIYHTAYALAPPLFKSSSVDRMEFIRGASPGEDVFRSGLGAYRTKRDEKENASVSEMFGIPSLSLEQRWNDLIQNVYPERIQFPDHIRFLREEPPFTRGYWSTDMPKKLKGFSIAYSQNPVDRTYYLYRLRNGSIEGKMLPSWQTEGFEYLNLANACLASKHILPAATFAEDGDIVYLDLGYLYPPAEQNFLMLYSWPQKHMGLPNKFRHTLDKRVFFAIKTIFEEYGYTFAEKR